MADYTTDRAKRLESDGFTPDQPWKERSSISVSENGKTYKAQVATGLVTAVFQVDGKIIKAGAKCDKFLAALSSTRDILKGVSVFIELKGKDISHAIDQLEATLKSRQFKPLPNRDDLVRARIVTAGCGPKSSSKVKLEESRRRFKLLYNTELRVLKNLQSDTPISL